MLQVTLVFAALVTVAAKVNESPRRTAPLPGVMLTVTCGGGGGGGVPSPPPEAHEASKTQRPSNRKPGRGADRMCSAKARLVWRGNGIRWWWIAGEGPAKREPAGVMSGGSETRIRFG